MFELCQALSAIEFFPFSGADLTANSVHIKNLLCQQQALGLESNVIDVVVPPGMFPKGAEPNLGPGPPREKPLPLAKKPFPEPAHFLVGWENTLPGRPMRQLGKVVLKDNIDNNIRMGFVDSDFPTDTVLLKRRGLLSS